MSRVDNGRMDILISLFDFILHIDRHLALLVQEHGTWVYLVLFLIVFVETGLVVMPLLPGDSLLFVVGAMGGAGLLNLPLAMGLLVIAAIAGDQCNYFVGRYFGQRLLDSNTRWFNRKSYEQAHAFYEKYGALTIIAARFLPFVRTFAPFVAGVSHMDRARFTLFNVSGAVLWVVGVSIIGYVFGNIPWVQQHFEKFIWALIVVPGLIAVWGAIKSRTQSAG
jgi:membrane-associated protein